MAHLTHKQPNRCSSPPPMRQKSICQHGKSNNQCAIDLQSQNVMTSRRVWTSVGATSSPHMCIHTHTRLLHLWPHSQSIDQTNRQSVDQSVMQRGSPSVSQSVSQSVMKAGGSSVDQTVSQSVRQPISHQSVSHAWRQVAHQSIRQTVIQSTRQTLKDSVQHLCEFSDNDWCFSIPSHLRAQQMKMNTQHKRCTQVTTARSTWNHRKLWPREGFEPSSRRRNI